MTEQEVLGIFEQTGAIMHGHFKLTSGMHSDVYVEKFRILEWPEHTAALCQEIASRFAGEGVDLVVGPAVGGILIAYETARALGCRAIYAEREGGKLTFRRGFRIEPARRVLVVEDITTTGGSIREVLDLVRGRAEIVGIGCFADRSGGAAQFDVRFEPLVTLDMPKYDPSECPLCQQGVPLTEPGSRGLA